MDGLPQFVALGATFGLLLVTFLYLRATQNLLKITGFGSAATNLIAMKRVFAESSEATHEVLEEWPGFRSLRHISVKGAGDRDLSAPALLAVAAAYWHMDAAFMASRTAGVEQPWLQGVQREIDLWLRLPVIEAVYHSHIRWTLAHSNGFLNHLATTFNDHELLAACRAPHPTATINTLRDQRMRQQFLPEQPAEQPMEHPSAVLAE